MLQPNDGSGRSSPNIARSARSAALGNSTLRRYFDRLLEALGPQGWWPARTRLEVIVGAILTQNTTWRNAARAIAQLRERGLLSVKRLRHLQRQLAGGRQHEGLGDAAGGVDLGQNRDRERGCLAGSGLSQAEQIAALDSAYQSGVLTKEEYDAKKAAIVGPAAAQAPAVQIASTRSGPHGCRRRDRFPNP